MQTICVVDDDGAVRDSIRMVLERRGFAVRCYANADILLAQSNLRTCACLLIDQIMPGQNGLGAMRSLKTRDIDIPTIVLTGDSDPLLPLAAKRAGAVTTLHKPAPIEDLLYAIDQAITRTRAVQPGGHT